MSRMTQKQKEARRMRAAGMIEKGWPVPAVARRLGVGENIVYVWRKKLREGGREALAARPAGGVGLPSLGCHATP